MAKKREIIIKPDWAIWISRDTSALGKKDFFIITSSQRLFENLTVDPLMFIGLAELFNKVSLNSLFKDERFRFRLVICVTQDNRNAAYFFVCMHKEYAARILVFDPTLCGTDLVDTKKWIRYLLNSERPRLRLLGIRERALLVHEHLLNSEEREKITVDKLYNKYCEIFWMESPPAEKEDAKGKSRKTDFLKALALKKERLDLLYDRHLKKLETKKFLNRQLLPGYAEKLLKCIKSP